MKFQAGDKVKIRLRTVLDHHGWSKSVYVVSRPSYDPRYGWKYSLSECDDPAGCYIDSDFREGALILVGNGLQLLLKIKGNEANQ